MTKARQNTVMLTDCLGTEMGVAFSFFQGLGSGSELLEEMYLEKRRFDAPAMRLGRRRGISVV